MGSQIRHAHARMDEETAVGEHLPQMGEPGLLVPTDEAIARLHPPGRGAKGQRPQITVLGTVDEVAQLRPTQGARAQVVGLHERAPLLRQARAPLFDHPQFERPQLSERTAELGTLKSGYRSTRLPWPATRWLRKSQCPAPRQSRQCHPAVNVPRAPIYPVPLEPL